MKLPKMTMGDPHSRGLPGGEEFRTGLPAGGRGAGGTIQPMAVAFSPRWNYYSWSNAGHTDTETERQLVLEMIRNSDSQLVRDYAASSNCDLYVRTGLHTSPSDAAEHVQVQLGIASPPYFSSTCPAYTCHIRYDASRRSGYPTQCWPGIG